MSATLYSLTPGGNTAPSTSVAASMATAPAVVSLDLIQRHDPRRAHTEAFIAGGFAKVYQASIRQFMPQLLAVNLGTEPQAVLGIRSGLCDKLFVEQYLDADISYVLRAIGISTSRGEIAEIGNLYAGNRHYTLMLMVTAAAALYQAGFRHLVCCATLQVQQLLSKHGLTLQFLAEGDPARLQGDSGDWGSYYQSHPMVCHLDLAQAMQLIQAEPRLTALTNRFALCTSADSCALLFDNAALEH